MGRRSCNAAIESAWARRASFWRSSSWLMSVQRRRFDIFSMSFLDTICCAFGAIVLLYMILNASSGRTTQHQSAASRAEADRLETQVLDGYENLVVLTNALKSSTNADASAQGQSSRLMDELTQ